MRKGHALVIGILLLVLLLAGYTNLSVVWAAPVAQGMAIITSPQSLTTVRGNVVIEGSASHPDFWKYEVHYGMEPSPSEWFPIGSVRETPVVSGRLEIWNTGLVPDGTYSLRLRVARRDGNYDEYYVRQLTVANTQPTETPTPEEEPTPEETETPTPLPPTPTIVIEQPIIQTPTPTPTVSQVFDASPSPTPAEMTEVSAQSLFDNFCRGSGYVAAVFLGLGILALARKIIMSGLRWVYRRIRRPPEESPWD